MSFDTGVARTIVRGYNLTVSEEAQLIPPADPDEFNEWFDDGDYVAQNIMGLYIIYASGNRSWDDSRAWHLFLLGCGLHVTDVQAEVLGSAFIECHQAYSFVGYGLDRLPIVFNFEAMDSEALAEREG